MPSLVATLGLNAAAFFAGADSAKGKAKTVGSDIESSFGNIKQKIAGLAGAAFLFDKTKEVMDYASEVGTLATRLGISTDAVQAWDHSLQLSGSSIQEATKFFEMLNKTRRQALDGDKEQVEAYQRLGISMKELASLRVEDLGIRIAGIAETGDIDAIFGDLAAVGGKSIGKLMEAFKEGLVETIQDTKEMGLVIDEEVIGRLKQAGDDWLTYGRQIMAGFSVIIDPIVSAVTFLAGAGIRVIGAISAMAGGFSADGFEGAHAALREFVLLESKHDKARQKREEDRKNPKDKTPLNLDEESLAAKDKAAKEEEKRAERILKLRDKLLEKQQANAFAEMSAAEQLEEIERRRLELKEKIANSFDDEEKLNAQLDLEDLDKMEKTAAKSLEKEAGKEGGKARLHSVNSLQQIGGFLGNFAAAIGPEVAAMNAQVKSEQHLSDIKKLLARSQAGKSSAEVEY